MTSLFLHELRQNRRSAIIWILSLVAATALYMSLFPAFAKEAAALQKMIMNFPAAVRNALGITIDSYTSIASFYAMILGFITLAGAIQAMNIGTSIVSKEERGKTAEFLLAKPLRRTDILTAKLAAALVILVITNAVFLVSVRLFIIWLADTPIDLSTFMLLSATLFFVQLFFAGLGFLISVSAKRIKSVLSISLSTVFGFYIVGMFDAVLGAKTARYFTPFKFFDYKYVIKHGSYEWRYVALEATFVVAAIAAGYLIYMKRDIKSL